MATDWDKQPKVDDSGQGFLVAGFLTDGFLVGEGDSVWTKQEKEVST